LLNNLQPLIEQPASGIVLLYAVNKEVDFVPQKFGYLRLKETAVTDNHWSVRAEKK
jgi:hypothetical protein